MTIQQIDWMNIWTLLLTLACLAVLGLFYIVVKERIDFSREGDELCLNRRPSDDAYDETLRAEAALLGGILVDCLNATCLGGVEMCDIFKLIGPDSFYHPRHKIIFAAMSEIQKYEDIDLVSLTNKLRRARQLDEVGGIEYLVGLIEVSGHPKEMLEYAKWRMPCKCR